MTSVKATPSVTLRSSSPSSPTSSSKMDGSKFHLATKESTNLTGEAASTPKRFQRAIDSFVLLVDGRPSVLDKGRFTKQDWKNVSVIGAVTSLVGEESIFAQCGWFGRVSWLWMKLPIIQEIKLKHDIQFRGGAPCIWLKTSLGDYAMYSPHKQFSSYWDGYLSFLGEDAMSSRFQRVQIDGPPPDWWSRQALELWPLSDSPRSSSLAKHQASTTTESLEALSLIDANKKQRRSDPPDEAAHQSLDKTRTGDSEPKGRRTSEHARRPWSLTKNLVNGKSDDKSTNA